MAVALLVAAGRGERLGTGGPKAFVMLGGRPMLQWSIDALRAVDEVDRDDAALAAATDDASLVESGGGTVRLVRAPRENLKVTTPLDLRLAELLLAAREEARC